MHVRYLAYKSPRSSETQHCITTENVKADLKEKLLKLK